MVLLEIFGIFFFMPVSEHLMQEIPAAQAVLFWWCFIGWQIPAALMAFFQFSKKPFSEYLFVKEWRRLKALYGQEKQDSEGR